MTRRPVICFTFVGDAARDSRLRRMALAAAERADVVVLQLAPAGGEYRSRLRGAGDVESSVDVISIPMRGGLRSSLPAFWRSGPAALRALDASLFIASDLYSLPVATRAAGRAGVPLLYDARELYSSVAALQGRSIVQSFWTRLERSRGRRARTVLTVNESIAGLLRSRFPDVRVIRNVPDFPPPVVSDLLRTAAGIPPDRHVLLSQGGLQKGRGALPLITALRSLPDCHLVFLGDGPLGGDIAAAAAIEGVSDRVTCLPAVPSIELPGWTASADLGFCLIENLGRSYHLSLPNKLFEYIAAGVPVVGSDFPEIGALLRDTGAGIAVDPSDNELLVRAVRTLLDDRTRYERAVEACRDAAKQYHGDVEKGRFLALMDEVLGG